MADVPGEKLVEAHGSFHSAHCLGCRKEYPHEWIKGTERFYKYIAVLCLKHYTNYYLSH